MKQLSSQRHPTQDKRSPWGGKALLIAAPLGCSAAGALVCPGGKGWMSISSAGNADVAPGSGASALDGAATGLIIGIIAAHAIRRFQRR